MIPLNIVLLIMVFCLIFTSVTLGLIVFTISSFIGEGIKWYNICTLILSILCLLFMGSLL